MLQPRRLITFRMLQNNCEHRVKFKVLYDPPVPKDIQDICEEDGEGNHCLHKNCPIWRKLKENKKCV